MSEQAVKYYEEQRQREEAQDKRQAEWFAITQAQEARSFEQHESARRFYERQRRHVEFVEAHYVRQTDALESIATALMIISSHYIEGCDEHE